MQLETYAGLNSKNQFELQEVKCFLARRVAMETFILHCAGAPGRTFE